MDLSELTYLTSSVASLALAILVVLAPRFGKTSWLLSLYLAVPAVGFGFHALIVGAPGWVEWEARLSFSSLLLALPAALAFLWTFDRPDHRTVIQRRWKALPALVIPPPFLAVLLHLAGPALDDPKYLSGGFVALGPFGYLSSLYMLIVSVAALARLEQVVRTTEERVRWEIKFLALGLAVSLASVIYIISKVLLYPFRLALLPFSSLLVFPAISLLATLLVLLSWRRSSGRTIFAVSQSFVYSSITLLAVGIYLIISSLLAGWTARLGGGGLEIEAIVFLVFAVALGTVLLWTGFRHRSRQWLRRNIFAGRYDYRQYWMEASEQIRSLDQPESAARSLAEITHRALGAIDVSVWLRERNPNRLRLLAALGNSPQLLETEGDGIVESLVEYTEPVDEKDIASNKPRVLDFMGRTHSTLLVPLVSSDRLVAVLTVGPDRSGHGYTREAREFLKVLAGHAAGEFHKADLLATVIEAKEIEAFRTFSTFLLHDLKNFASTLSLIARNADRHADNPEFQKDAFRSVYDTAEKMKRLCNSLRTFSGTLSLNRKLQDLNQIVKEAADNMGGGIGTALRLDLGNVPQVLVDPEEMMRVLQNLVLNAREAISDGGEIVLKTDTAGGKVRLSVRDNGRGITSEFLRKELFHPFHTTKTDGLGIGLFQVKRIVEAHGGRIDVESEPGKGTTVSVWLPGA